MDLFYFFLPSVSISLHLYFIYFTCQIYIGFVITFLLFSVPFSLINSPFWIFICHCNNFILRSHQQAQPILHFNVCNALPLPLPLYLPQFQYSHPVCCTSGHSEHFRKKACHGFCQFPFTFPPGPTSWHSTPFGLHHTPYLPSKPSITNLGFSLSICEQLLPPDYFKLILCYLFIPSYSLTPQLITGWTVLGWSPGGGQDFPDQS